MIARCVARLCAQDELSEGAGGGLLDEIEAVVFSRLDDSDATFASSFAGLRDAKCEPFDVAMRSLTQEISELTGRIFNARESEAQQGARREALKKHSKEVEAVEQHTQKLVGSGNPALLREVQELQAKATEARGLIAGLRATDQGLESLAGKYRQLDRQLSSFHNDEARQKLLHAGASKPSPNRIGPRRLASSHSSTTSRDYGVTTVIDGRFVRRTV